MKNYGLKEIAAEQNISTKQISRYLQPFRHLLTFNIKKRLYTEDERQFIIELIKNKRKYKKLKDN